MESVKSFIYVLPRDTDPTKNVVVLFFFTLVEFKHLHKHPVHLSVSSLEGVPFRFKFRYSACKSLT